MTDSTDLQSVRERLARREQELRAEIAAAGHAAPGHDHDVADTKDEAGEHEMSGVAAAEVERDLGELREVLAAQRNIDAGRYGLCADCGEPIDARRLAAQPVALRCTACQAAHEG